MARASPASTKTNWRNATNLGDVEGYLGAQCVPAMCVLWKITSGNFYIAKSEIKVYIVVVRLPQRLKFDLLGNLFLNIGKHCCLFP